VRIVFFALLHAKAAVDPANRAALPPRPSPQRSRGGAAMPAKLLRELKAFSLPLAFGRPRPQAGFGINTKVIFEKTHPNSWQNVPSCHYLIERQ
jgi:hypothetical protein